MGRRGKQRAQPLVNGYSTGCREVRDGALRCPACGEFKPATTEFFGLARKRWAQACRPCEADRMAYDHLRKRVATHGVQAEIKAIQDAERVIEDRKRRLARYVFETSREKESRP